MAPPASFPDSFHSAAIVGDLDDAMSSARLTLRHNGEAFTLADGVKRRELLGKMADGETVELQIDFRAFQQQEGVPNRNFLKFAKKILRPLAKSFTNTPFLRDHDTFDFDARAGTITKSKAVAIEGGLAFDMTADVTAPFAVEALLRGLLDRFSIGWFHGGLDTILCSHCETPIFAECSHWPGDKVENEKTGGQDVIEFVFTEAEGKETSAVTIPAVRGTEIQDVRAALSTAPQCAADNRADEETDMDLKKIAAKLGLPEDATEETILAAVDASQTAQAEAGAELTALRSSQNEMRTELTALAVNDKQRTVDSLFVEFADRIPKARNPEGALCAHPTEVELRKLAASDPAAARGILSSMPAVRPEGDLQSLPDSQRLNVPDARDERIPAGVQWNGHIESALAQLDLGVDDYVEHGPHKGTPKVKFYNGVQLSNSRH